MPKILESKKSSRNIFWANFLLTFGLLTFVLFAYLIYQRYNPQKLSFNINEVKASGEIKSDILPVGLEIKSISLLLPLTPAGISNNKWQASSNSVSYLNTSVIPGQKGNSILYGHNWPNLLGNLSKTKTGDKITIIYSNNSKKDFEVEYIKKVSPFETSILEDTDDYRITLYTCTGFLDSERLVVVAKLLES